MKNLLFYPVSNKVVAATIPTCFVMGYIGGRIYRSYQDRALQRTLAEAFEVSAAIKDKIAAAYPNVRLDDEELHNESFMDLDEEDVPEGSVAVLQPLQDWFAGSNTNAEFLNQDQVDLLLLHENEAGDIVVPQTMLCANAETCSFHAPPETTEKYERSPSAPQHSAKARKHRERALGLGIFESPEVEAEPIGLGTEMIQSDFERLAQEADEHAKCYDLQRTGAGASTCLVDGEQPHNCPHYHEWDLTMP